MKKYHRRWLALSALLTLATSLMVAHTAPARAETRIFGAEEERAQTIHLFPQWTSTLARHASDLRAVRQCDARTGRSCHLAEWRAFLDSVRGSDPMTQLRRVNEYVNRIRHVPDPANYGVPDYWSTPREFFAASGDCEDYAIVKYLSLRALGWPAGALRVLVLRDRNRSIGHAVLLVYMHGTAYVLDSLGDEIVDHRRIGHYQPVYSLNENSWWIHRQAGQQLVMLVTPGGRR